LGLAALPRGINWIHIIGLSFLAGIGFTMALFIATLAFETQATLLAQAKIGILVGSVIASLLGISVFLTAKLWIKS
jgi:NhaA family Na+:H+ antiporter